VSYLVPAYGDIGYAQGAGNLSAYLIAIAAGSFQQTGGNFTLTADANFGPTYGLLAAYYKSRTANTAAAGNIRLARTDTINWRNNANLADLPLAVSASDRLTFNGTELGTDVLTNAHIYVGNVSNVAADVPMTGDVAITNTGATSVNNVQNGVITNVMVNSAAAIAYSKLNLSSSIVNGDVATAAAIAYSKLNLSSSIVNGDVATAAAIAHNKMAALSASIVPVTDASGFLTSSSITATTLGFLDATSSIQTQLNGKVSKAGDTMTGDLTMTLNKSVIFNDNQGSPVAVTLKAPVTVTSAYTLKLPPTAGTNNYVLKTDGSGNTDWVATGVGTVNSGTAGQVAYYATSSNAVSTTGAFTVGSNGPNGIVKGTNTDDNAVAGCVGEYILSTSQADVALTTGTWVNLTSISLSPGDWDVSAAIVFRVGSASGWLEADTAVSVNSGNTTTDHYVGYNELRGFAPTTANSSVCIPLYRLSLGSTTTVYIKGNQITPGSTGTGRMSAGFIAARRVR